MIKKGLLIGLGFAVLSSAFLVINMPMRWVVAQIQQSNPAVEALPVTLNGVKGSIWSGHLSVSGKAALPIKGAIRRVSWLFNPSELMRGYIGYDLVVERVAVAGTHFGDFDMSLYYGSSEDFSVQIKDTNSPLSLQAVLAPNEKGQKLLAGVIKLKEKNSSLQSLLALAGKRIKSDGSFSIIVP